MAGAGTIKLGDMTVHRLGFGAMRITGPGVWGEPERPDEARAVLRRAVELGVDLIDTADSYGPEVSERIIGETFPRYPAGLVVATKGGHRRPGPDDWRPDGRPEHLREAVMGSLKRLHVPRIDLWQYHRPDRRVPFAESMRAVAEMRDEGLLRHVGVCNVSPEQLDVARGIVPIVSVQNRYHLEDRHNEDVLEACEKLGIAFIPWYPLGAGDLAAPDGPLAGIARRLGATPAQLALAWLLWRSPIMLPIPGTSRVAHLEENFAAATITLSDADAEAIERAARPGR